MRHGAIAAVYRRRTRRRAGLAKTRRCAIIQAIEYPTCEAKSMKKYVCTVCGYVYDPAEGDPDAGVAAGTAFEDLAADWVRPVCGASKEDFEPQG